MEITQNINKSLRVKKSVKHKKINPDRPTEFLIYLTEKKNTI